MTTSLESPAIAGATHTGPTPLGLIRAEIMKIRTTNTWWLFGIGVFLVTALALFVNWLNHHFTLHPPLKGVDSQTRAQLLADAAAAHSHAGQLAIAADMMTAGQFFGLLFAMLIGVLVITNEFHHQTASATFMTNPHRTAVVLAKLAAASVFGVLFWLMVTVIDAIATPIFLHTEHLSVSLTAWVVVRSVLLNLLAFVMWSIFGLGLGTLIRSQIGSVVTGVVVYLIGFAAVELIFHLIYNVYHHNWVLGATVIAPAVASMVMTTPGKAFDHAPPQWAGVLVMAGYVVLLGGIGIALTRKRDIT